ncbi:hypothetical protein TCON_1057 [Astathelohania contejeani]|uniref:Rhoptry protein n=1 Tax=Astathelohania contejeani TaxID=164912 RepID=A0ABQ7HZT9_9MICR|nr:hypothetical protein TCON_1057 [Thelohania contejeani]
MKKEIESKFLFDKPFKLTKLDINIPTGRLHTSSDIYKDLDNMFGIISDDINIENKLDKDKSNENIILQNEPQREVLETNKTIDDIYLSKKNISLNQVNMSNIYINKNIDESKPEDYIQDISTIKEKSENEFNDNNIKIEDIKLPENILLPEFDFSTSKKDLENITNSDFKEIINRLPSFINNLISDDEKTKNILEELKNKIKVEEILKNEEISKNVNLNFKMNEALTIIKELQNNNELQALQINNLNDIINEINMRYSNQINLLSNEKFNIQLQLNNIKKDIQMQNIEIKTFNYKLAMTKQNSLILINNVMNIIKELYRIIEIYNQKKENYIDNHVKQVKTLKEINNKTIENLKLTIKSLEDKIITKTNEINDLNDNIKSLNKREETLNIIIKESKNSEKILLKDLTHWKEKHKALLNENFIMKIKTKKNKKLHNNKKKRSTIVEAFDSDLWDVFNE